MEHLEHLCSVSERIDAHQIPSISPKLSFAYQILTSLATVLTLFVIPANLDCKVWHAFSVTTNREGQFELQAMVLLFKRAGWQQQEGDPSVQS